MKSARVLASRLRGTVDPSSREGDFDAELQSHIELHTDDGVRAGLTREEARRRAIVALGGIEPTKELHRERRGIPFLETAFKDFAFALRGLRKNPGFAAAAIGSLALGIGAATSMYSVVHAALLRPLPYAAPDRLVHIGQRGTGADVSRAELWFVRANAASFTSAAGSEGGGSKRLVRNSVDEWLPTLAVSPGFFRVLGGDMAAGREFEDRAAYREVILSDRLWRASFGADPALPGSSVSIDGVAYTVAGIAPAGFWYAERADIYLPLVLTGGIGDRGANVESFARLKDGVTPEAAASELAALSARFPGPDAEYAGMTAIPYRQWIGGDIRSRLFLLLGAVGLLLAIACLNVGCLLWARWLARQDEVAVRLALGSGTARLLQQFVIENAVLAAFGAGLGVFLAWWTLDMAATLVPSAIVPGGVRLSLPVLAATAGVSAAVVLLLSLAPLSLRNNLAVHDALRRSGRLGASGGSARVPGLLVAGEVALASVLVAGSALLLHGLYALNSEPLGFDPDGLQTMWTPPEHKSGERLRRVEADYLERLRAVPGARSAAAVNVLPLSGKNNFPAQREGRPDQSVGGMEVRIVTPGYFETMGIAMRRGRTFGAGDQAGAAPAVVINETLARQWWPDGAAIGDRVALGYYQGKPVMPEAVREVIGIAADTKTLRLNEPPRPTLYIPAAQAAWYGGGMSWVVRGGGPGFGPSLAAAIRSVDPAQRVERVWRMRSIVDSAKTGTRLNAALFGAFAVLALAAAAAGLYGLLSFAVARRTREIGLRIALGATGPQVARAVVGQALWPAVGGLAVGAAGAVVLGNALGALLHGVQPADPLSLGATAAILALVCALAAWAPARRAAGVEPLAALRTD